jgi:DNA-binding NarL/FixJ family response regulator
VTVLVADDMPDIRLLLKATFDLDTRFDVVGEAASAHECLELARRLKPEVVVLDLGMPGGEGLETVARLRTMLPDGRIVVLSGQHHTHVAADVMASGADAYLQKGSAVNRLVALLQEYFQD